MSRYLVCLTAAATLALCGQAFAQMAAPAPAGASMPATASASASVAAPTAPDKVAVGLSVKDKTGVTIGTITDLKPDTSGNQMATIKMGTDSFSMAAANMGVQDGVATVNASRQEIVGMMKKPKS